MTRLNLFLLVLSLAAINRPAIADVGEFQDIAQDHPFLIHQYTFDGADLFEKRQDNRGKLDLIEQAAGAARRRPARRGPPAEVDVDLPLPSHSRNGHARICARALPVSYQGLEKPHFRKKHLF